MCFKGSERSVGFSGECALDFSGMGDLVVRKVSRIVSDRVVILVMRQVKTAFKSLRGLD